MLPKVIDYKITGLSIEPSGCKKYPWRFNKKCTIRITLDGAGVLEFVIKPGFETDFASVPGVFRGFVDNGFKDLKMAYAAIPHDIGYACHFAGFGKEWFDTLMSRILDYNKFGNPLKRTLVRLGIKTPFARMAWNNGKKYSEEDRKLISFKWLDR